VLARPQSGRILGGVCAGLADYFALDVTLVRLTFLLLTLAWGIGAVLYGLSWLLLPETGRSQAPLRKVMRANARTIRRRAARVPGSLGQAWSRSRGSLAVDPLDRRVLAFGLIALGSLVLLWSFGMFAWLSPTRIAGLGAIALGSAALLGLGGRGR
jgi:phage shock protein C